MGHQFSKPGESSSDHARLGDASQKVLDYDGMSRATEITDESMTPPPSPSVGKFRHSQSWRRGADLHWFPSQQSHGLAGSHSANSEKAPSAHVSRHHDRLPRRDSDSGSPIRPDDRHQHHYASHRPRTVPVRCPARKRQGISGDLSTGDDGAGPASSEHGLEASYLERMYDSRTWEMYRRITEARRQSRTKYAPKTASTSEAAAATVDPRQGTRGLATVDRMEDMSEWENLQHEEEASGEAQHEMIFLFDF